MKIVMIVYLYPPFPGGVAESVYRLCSELVNLGHQITVFTTDSFNNEKAPKNEVANGITVKRMSKIFPDKLISGKSILNPFKIIKELNIEKPDIIHLHGFGFIGNEIAVLFKRNVPIILTTHGPGWSHDPNRAWYLHVMWQIYLKLLGFKILRKINKVVALSPHEFPYWGKWHVPTSKLEIIPWGINKDCFIPHDGILFRNQWKLHGPILLFVGSHHPSKGPQRLIMALPEILKDFPSATVVMCGPELGYKTQLETLSYKLGVNKNVLFLGYISRDELLKAYTACDIFVLPTDYEAFGIVLAEAMALGKPIVASNTGAVPYVVEDGGNGFLIDKSDISLLSEKIKILLNDDTLRLSFGAHSKKLSLKYQWDNIGHLYENIYTSFVSSELSTKK